MPRVKTMTQLIEILVRLKKGESIRNIKKETGTHRSVIRKVKKISQHKGWLLPSSTLPNEFEMEFAYNKTENAEIKVHILDKYYDDLERYKTDGKSFVVIHRLISEHSDCENISETTVRRYIHRKFPVIPDSVMIRSLEDAVMEVDFGYLGIVYDPLQCCKKRAWIFSGRLRKSRKAYREVVYDQKKETFLKCHIGAFHHFGGVPKKVVPDNLKSAVVKAAFYDPIINQSYQELARHYDFLISPCLPAKPMHKGGVENDIKYVTNNFWPYFVEKQKQRGHDIPFSIEIDEALNDWDRNIADVRIIKGVGVSPYVLFIEELKTLSKLPAKDWDPVIWKKCHVRSEWRIQFDSAFYSVPYKYIGEEVMVCANSSYVRIFYEYELIANHERATKKWDYKRNTYHAPPNKEKYIDMTKESILSKAGNIGISTLEVVRIILSNKHIDGFRSARGVAYLDKKYSKERVERACKRALFYDATSYTSIKAILEKGLDLNREAYDDERATVINPLPFNFKFARNNNYFNLKQ